MAGSDQIGLYIGLWTVLGALVGGFISTLLTREHKISTFRQEWIDKVRNLLSETLTQGEVYTDVAYKNDEEAYREKVKLLALICQLKLFLNREEQPSKTVLENLEGIPEEYLGRSGGRQEYARLKNELAVLMQNLLKEEWNRVRDGELIWSANKYIKSKKWPKWVILTRLKLAIFLGFFLILLATCMVVL
ncbi:hypothetical protein JX580_09760 [Thiomicrospira microaerophila]|uniref:hypothetical protein n=1 Tax=Thiomicrospira microaerophila TaxID=406020 RepID=UPI00200D0046|nr:hypothetical protein [Thiomicrospira microaerophila]UQB41941.1 hypothetical protein JX580_09760 [Thiomicrospira microaerophila]